MKKIIAIYCMCLAYCYASNQPFTDEVKRRHLTTSTFDIARDSAIAGVKLSGCLAPVYYGLMWKSALATDMPFNTKYINGVACGVRSMPINGGVLGVQIFLQKLAEAKAREYGYSELSAASGACVFSAAVSAPGLALMNELTRGTTFKRAITTTWQTRGAWPIIFWREGTFIPVLACTPQITEYAKTQYGDSALVTTGTQVLFAGVGATIGQPFDVWATRMQAGMPFVFRQHAFRGILHRTGAIIGLTLLSNNLP